MKLRFIGYTKSKVEETLFQIPQSPLFEFILFMRAMPFAHSFLSVCIRIRCVVYHEKIQIMIRIQIILNFAVYDSNNEYEGIIPLLVPIPHFPVYFPIPISFDIILFEDRIFIRCGLFLCNANHNVEKAPPMGNRRCFGVS